MLAPRPGGVLAALDAAPEADVVLVAHTGLDHMLTVGDVWRELPMDKRIIMRWWQVPREEIPADREERIDWLFGWWERIDAWIAREPAGGCLLRAGPAYARGGAAVSGFFGGVLVDVDDVSAGSSGVVTSCGSSAASAIASSGDARAPLVGRRSRLRRVRPVGVGRRASGRTTTASCRSSTRRAAS